MLVAQRVHIVQHLPFTEPGHIGWWALREGLDVTGTIPAQGDKFPDVDVLDAVAIIGAPDHPTDDRAHPWLEDERVFLTQAIEDGLPVLGVARAGELLAHLLGGGTTPAKAPVVGWFDVELTEAGLEDPALSRLPSRFEAFHWSRMAMELPPPAVSLATAEMAPHQAFRYEDNVLALQFDMGLGPSDVSRLAAARPDDLATDSPYVQKVADMVEPPERFRDAHQRLQAVLDAWFNKAPPPAEG